MKKLICLLVCLLFATSLLVAACAKKEEPAVKPAEPEKKAEEKPAEPAKAPEPVKAPEKK